MSLMAAEIAEMPRVAREVLRDSSGAIGTLANRLRGLAPPFAAVCGRGSSGNAAQVLRVLVETRLGLPVADVSPSLTTLSGVSLRLSGVPFFVVSQSGASPDIVAATRAARDAGATTIALLNVPDAPLAGAATHVVPLRAHPERSVAATKSVIGAIAAGARLVADWCGDESFARSLASFPDALAEAAGHDWSAWGARLAAARAVVVAGRGLGLPIAQEIALKASEVLRVPGLAFSTAEIRHGPRAALSADTPVLVLPSPEDGGAAAAALAADLRATGVPVFVTGADLPAPAPRNPLDAALHLAPAYRAIEAAARAAGLDPDAPPGLSKVTVTL
jgi:glucosamine--fructose-6-phosphate aminotransferase (isomerizing)